MSFSRCVIFTLVVAANRPKTLNTAVQCSASLYRRPFWSKVMSGSAKSSEATELGNSLELGSGSETANLTSAVGAKLKDKIACDNLQDSVGAQASVDCQDSVGAQASVDCQANDPSAEERLNGEVLEGEAHTEKTEIHSVNNPQPSKRSRRSKRRGQLHKRQLEAADGETANTTGDNKRQKMEEDKIEEQLNETDCYIENGLRKVYPYRYTYLCYCKERWKGRTLLDVLTNEFMAGNSETHIYQIENGFVKVNGKNVSGDYMLKGKNELISNVTHRHELPVTAQPIKVLLNTDEYVVVDKPSSIPVHPCGRYRHNSVIFILGRDCKLHNLRTIYRLDRLTSGLLIFGKTHDATNHIMDSIKERKVTKTYLCRVQGEFPDGTIECREPLDKVHPKIGTWRVKEGGKPSHTTFEKVSYNGTTSVVKCYPHTGRTHQIRVHLQYLGHPIVNDPLYNDDVWGQARGKSGEYGKSDTQLYEDLVSMHSNKLFEEELESSEEELPSPVGNVFVGDPRLTPDPNCDYCKKRYRDPQPSQLVMYLHALSYKGPDWEYSTDEPSWAQESWVPTV